MSTFDHDDDAALDARLAAAGAQPRALPDDLRDALVDACHAAAAVDALVTSAAPRAVPAGLRERLLALTGATGVTNAAGGPRRFRLLRGGPYPRPLVLSVAAVTIALLVTASSVAISFGSNNTGDDGGATYLAAPTTTTTDDATTDTTGVIAPVGPTPTTAVPATTTTSKPAPPKPRPKPAPIPPPPPPGSGLVLASSCDTLLDRIRNEAGGRTGPYGVAGGRQSSNGSVGLAAGGAGGGDEPAPDASETNAQEAGVGEADVVKNDANRLFVLTRNQTVRAFSLTTGGVEPRGSLAFETDEYAQEMLLVGNRLVLFGASIDRSIATSRATVWVVDVADLDAPRRIATLRIDGGYVASRSVDGVVRLVVHALRLGPEMVYPEDNTDEAEQQATQENRRRVAASTLADWLPAYRMVMHDPAGDRVTEGLVCACEGTFLPESFGTFDSLTVMTIDPANPEQRASVSIEGGGGIVYSSRDRLYVATSPWGTVSFRGGGGAAFPAPAAKTHVHRFSIPRAGAPTYDASGEVPGALLNQFSMSEHEGWLRVASTAAGSPDNPSQSFVSILGQNGRGLGVVGQVGGLGRGESIFGVRFVGTTGYVVTFRRTDPLYVLDLADPGTPALKGELKIPGYSAYLHPVEDGRLLGIGQDADETGRTTGFQVSLFDVRDPAAPSRTHQKTYPATGSSAEWNHHAFLRWQPTGTTVVPLVTRESQPDGRYAMTSFALVLLTGPDRLDEQGRLSHDGRPRTGSNDSIVYSSLVARGSLYTISHAGILVNDLGTLAERQWLAL